MLSVDELRALSNTIADDPTKIKKLSPEEVAQVKKFINPLCNVVPDSKCYVNMSIVNWRDRYLRRLHMTALVGYLFRTAAEYEPVEELELENKRWEAEQAKLAKSDKTKSITDTDAARLKADHDARVALIKTTARRLITQFLCRNFKYDPDRHLCVTKTVNSSTKDAVKAACDRAPLVEEKLNKDPALTYRYMRENILEVYQTCSEATKATAAILRTLADPVLDSSDKHSIVTKKYQVLAGITQDMKKLAGPIEAAETLDAWTITPPANVFHHFDRYLTNHYEQLQEVVAALYNENPDFEFSVQVYGAFKTEAAAKEHRIRNAADFRAGVDTIENNGITLLGPFKENREKVSFYNKNTEIMQRMMEQSELDHKMGADIMGKKVKTEKKKNIAEAGPDAPELAAYSKIMSSVASLGAKKVLSPEELKELNDAHEAAKRIKEDYEVPDDAIQCDVWAPTEDGKLSRRVFYSQAEAPTFMQDPSRAHEPYQPVRDEDTPLKAAYRLESITAPTGEVKDILVSHVRES